MEFYRGDFQAGHPTFAEGSQAATQLAGMPVDISASKIVYSKEDDDAIDEFHRRTGSRTLKQESELVLTFVFIVESAWHPVCEQLILIHSTHMLFTSLNF